MSDQDELSQDVVFDLLSSPRRRFVLYYLREAGGPVELGTLADEVAAWENDTTVADLTSQQRKRVYVSLYQTHIPKLEESGILEYDADRSLVTLADRATDIGRYLRADEAQSRWGWYYLTLAVASVLLFLGVVFDVSVLGAVSPLVAAAVIVVAFFVTALLHRLVIQRTEMRALSTLVDREE